MNTHWNGTSRIRLKIGTLALFHLKRSSSHWRVLCRLERVTEAPWKTEHRVWRTLASNNEWPGPTTIDEATRLSWKRDRDVALDELPQYLGWTKTPEFDRILKGG